MARHWNCLRDLIVVTSDKPLGSSLESRGATIVRAAVFRRMLEDVKKNGADKPSEVALVDVDDWLAYFNADENRGILGRG